MVETDSVLSYLKAKSGIRLKRSFYNDWYRSQPSNRNYEQLCKGIYQHFLDSDIAESSEPVLKNGVNKDRVVLQLQHTVDTSHSLLSLIDTLGQGKEPTRGNLKWILTDGERDIPAYELDTVSCMKLMTPFGSKIEIKAALYARGILLVKNHNMKLLGGQVAGLYGDNMKNELARRFSRQVQEQVQSASTRNSSQTGNGSSSTTAFIPRNEQNETQILTSVAHASTPPAYNVNNTRSPAPLQPVRAAVINNTADFDGFDEFDQFDELDEFDVFAEPGKIDEFDEFDDDIDYQLLDDEVLQTESMSTTTAEISNTSQNHSQISSARQPILQRMNSMEIRGENSSTYEGSTCSPLSTSSKMNATAPYMSVASVSYSSMNPKSTKNSSILSLRARKAAAQTSSSPIHPADDFTNLTSDETYTSAVSTPLSAIKNNSNERNNTSTRQHTGISDDETLVDTPNDAIITIDDEERIDSSEAASSKPLTVAQLRPLLQSIDTNENTQNLETVTVQIHGCAFKTIKASGKRRMVVVDISASPKKESIFIEFDFNVIPSLIEGYALQDIHQMAKDDFMRKIIPTFVRRLQETPAIIEIDVSMSITDDNHGRKRKGVKYTPLARVS